jgi:hypothetical protein
MSTRLQNLNIFFKKQFVQKNNENEDYSLLSLEFKDLEASRAVLENATKPEVTSLN